MASRLFGIAEKLTWRLKEGPSMRLNTFLGCLFALMLVGGGGWYFAVAGVENPGVPIGVLSAISDSPPLTNETLVRVAEMTRPAVVNISSMVEVGRQDPRAPFPFFDDPFFRRFFGEEFERRFPAPPERREQGTGSGVIVSSDGYIITNHHVVEEAEDIRVLLADKRKFTAKLVGTDPKTDLAILKIEASNLPFLTWGDSNALRVGEMVIAVGSPFGLTQTVTMGIISAVGRAEVGIVDYEDFIQTDAAINPGNSGGALVNLKGELIGINTAIFTRSGGYMGIGFAIPSHMAKTVMKSLIDHGKVIRGWFGVNIQKLTPELAKQFNAPSSEGALVTNVGENSPAERANVKRGDVILRYDGRKVTDPSHLRSMVAETNPGTSVTLTILREGRERTLRLTVGEQPRDLFEGRMPGEVEGDHALAGVSVGPISPGKTPKDEGVIVLAIEPGSPVDRAGLREDDVILEINRQAVKDVNDFKRLARKLGPDDAVLLLLQRDEGIFFLTIHPER